jgi:hypothetical protein
LRDNGEKVFSVIDQTFWMDGWFLNSTSHDIPMGRIAQSV